MFYLALAILASFSISLLIKKNESDGIDSRVVLAANYISAAVIGWGLAWMRDGGPLEGTTLWLSLVGGLLWPTTFFLLMWGIRRYGMALAGSISRLSLSIPVLFGLLFLGETPTLFAVLGILATFAAFILLNPVRLRANRPLDRDALWYFPVLVFSFGIVDLWVNLFNTFGNPARRDAFTALLFTGAGIVAWLAILIERGLGKRHGLSPRALGRGLVLGLPNYFSTFFLMRSLKTPTFAGASAVAYALYSIAGVSLAFAAGTLAWDEEVSRPQMVGLAVAIAAIALLNLG